MSGKMSGRLNKDSRVQLLNGINIFDLIQKNQGNNQQNTITIHDDLT